MKKCNICNKEKDDSEFCANVSTKDGLQIYCRKCDKIRQREWRDLVKIKPKLDIKRKTCYNCHIEKDSTEFNKDNSSLDGLDTMCRECMNIKSREYYQQNKNKLLLYQQNYKKNNRSKVNAWGRRYKAKTNLHSNGKLDPLSRMGQGFIIEHIVSKVLCCEHLNKLIFNSEYDLESNIYGSINVKSSKLCYCKKQYYWHFRILKNSQIPDNYICVAYSKDKSALEHVWIIPADSEIIQKSGISIVRNNLKRAEQYEVDPTPYNEAYQNLDIYSLDEFRNLNNESSVTA